MMTFQRARTVEQRERRRRSILDAAAQMLTEMPVAELSLNELSRRVGLAKSNVLRYFVSREAVLLSLLVQETDAFVGALTERLAEPADRRRSPVKRGESLAQVVAQDLAQRPLLCELTSVQASVLERNISTEVAYQFKHSTLEHLGRFAGLVHRQLPELDEEACEELVGHLSLQIGAVWAMSRPSPALATAYREHPELARHAMDFTGTLQRLMGDLVAGSLVRAGAL
ncbi:TetR/AcrR family transcriptional regulator [Citricoccus sp. GCM10030269]|uniref:TetR/AcrR family transcriptional regulator n=1 Tax=Citricoccus sp. GCM10030269 TaxID=3273388 RepID=UPI00361DD117